MQLLLILLLLLAAAAASAVFLLIAYAVARVAVAVVVAAGAAVAAAADAVAAAVAGAAATVAAASFFVSAGALFAIVLASDASYYCSLEQSSHSLDDDTSSGILDRSNCFSLVNALQRLRTERLVSTAVCMWTASITRATELLSRFGQ